MVKLARRPVNRNPNSNFARKWTSSSSFYGDSTTPKLLPNLSETVVATVLKQLSFKTDKEAPAGLQG
ncbi:BnaC05g30100D [Brassica napus]|uniref:BnaC05g30100D protein n=1 Tax=Brassica napus TaxID=3708 RepID=A0A078HKB7_BRANA|nr:BnaC05g30100D [Brassica napus]